MGTWKWVLYHFLYICIFEIFHFKKWGQMVSALHSHSLPLTPPFQLNMHHVSSGLWQYSSNWQSSLPGKSLLFHCRSGQLSLPASTVRKNCSSSMLGAPSLWSIYSYHCKCCALVSLFISPVDSKHCHRWDNISAIFCLYWPLALCLA